MYLIIYHAMPIFVLHSYALINAVLSHPATESTLREVYNVLSSARDTTAGAGAGAGSSATGTGVSVPAGGTNGGGAGSTSPTGGGGEAVGGASTVVAGDAGYDYLQILSREETIKVYSFAQSKNSVHTLCAICRCRLQC